MSEKLIRIYKKLDIKNIKEHLLIFGDISGSCASCQAIDLKLNETHCPKCKSEFKFISFRSIKSHIPKLLKLHDERPDLVIVDIDDYQKNMGALKAEEFLK